MAMFIVLNKDNIDYAGFEFVIKALTKDKNEKRPHMLNLFVDDGRLVATDGRRLHAYDFKYKYFQGFYIVESKTKTKMILKRTGNKKSISYPAYKHLFDGKGKTIETLNQDAKPTFYKNVYSNTTDGRTFNLEYLKDLPGYDTELTFIEKK